jgi:DNA-binding NtrC family response regulator
LSSTRRLLFVDRDAALHAVIVAALRREKIAVTWAQDSAEALALLREHAFAILVVDAHHGDALLRGLRTHDCSLLRRTIVLAKRGAPESVFAVLRKPLSAMALLAAIRECREHNETAARLARALRELARTRRLLTELELDDHLRAQIDDVLRELDAQRRHLLAALTEHSF